MAKKRQQAAAFQGLVTQAWAPVRHVVRFPEFPTEPQKVVSARIILPQFSFHPILHHLDLDKP